MRTQVSAITFAGFGAAKINATTGEITPVNPGPVYKRGDLTLDGHVNAADLTAMVSALANPATYETSHSLTNDSLFAIGDMDADGHFTNLDLQGMITFLQSGQGSCAPRCRNRRRWLWREWGQAAAVHRAPSPQTG